VNYSAMKALTQWLLYAAIGGAIAVVAGLILRIPLPQLTLSFAVTAGLIFSGYGFRSRESRGRVATQSG
jgi:FtsH-binding integral membrane protein